MTELEEYRQGIDEIDAQLVDLFFKRMELTGKVGAYKKARGIPVLDANRERELMAKKMSVTEDPSKRADLEALYRSILAISRRGQRKLVREGTEDPGYAHWIEALNHQRKPVTEHPRVVYQGEPGAYSEEAAMGLFGEHVDARGLPWFDDVFDALAQGTADYAVLPIENSSTGSIRQVYDLLARHEFYLVGEWEVKVDHCLCALPGTGLDDITTVYSHEQGLMQCVKYLDDHHIETRIPSLDTAGSAREVKALGNPHAAAICSRHAARLYGLNILAESINHNASNYTRFVAVSPVLELREGRNKISTMFALPHQTGSLHEILTLFAVQGLNLLKLESRPILGRNWEYLFFLECSGDLMAQGMDGVLHELSQLSTEFRMLGNFKGYEE